MGGELSLKWKFSGGCILKVQTVRHNSNYQVYARPITLLTYFVILSRIDDGIWSRTIFYLLSRDSENLVFPLKKKILKEWNVVDLSLFHCLFLNAKFATATIRKNQLRISTFCGVEYSNLGTDKRRVFQ